MDMDSTPMAALVAAYGLHRPGELATLHSVMRLIVLPAIGWNRREPYEAAISRFPAIQLYGALAPDRRAWADGIRTKLPPGQTYHGAYLRLIKRVIDFGEGARMLHPDAYQISPEWRQLVALLPPLLGSLSPSRRSATRSAFKRLAKWATTAGLIPGNFRPAEGVPAVAGEFRATLPPSMRSAYFLARTAWRRLAEAHPDLALAPWPDLQSPQGLPRHRWPASVVTGLEEFLARDGIDAWSAKTRRCYEDRVACYLGALERLGLDAPVILAGAREGKDAFRLLFQGFPPGIPSTTLGVHAHELATNSEFVLDLLARMRDSDGSATGRASGPNPLLAGAVALLVKEDKPGSAAALVTRAIAINRSLFGLDGPLIRWLIERARLLGLAARRKPGRYARKKRVVFKNPELWVALVKARQVLRDRNIKLEAEWRQDPDSRQKARTWAVALRDEAMFGLLICYPLRVGNLVALKLGEHYDPDTHSISIPAEHTKNARDIDYELPDRGSLGDERDLAARYLAEARPILLAGRVSDFVFVGSDKGQPWLTPKTVHEILAGISRRLPPGTLPAGIAALNSHLMRHAAATYHLAIGHDLILAAQMLNDAPSTITRNYADVLDSAKAATKQFLSGFNL